MPTITASQWQDACHSVSISHAYRAMPTNKSGEQARPRALIDMIAAVKRYPRANSMLSFDRSI